MKSSEKIAEIRELTLVDLRERIETEKAEYVQLKINHAVSPVENTSKIRKARKDIARMLTILGQRENNEKK
ncbi:MAG: 50S ribosomal protein L29 [Prevotellaceae bacterium]|jgi:large subunit ribosomal protein L29|nr:50S ribosomal protein L29 [Prevotellaceae bacterium]